MSKSVNQTICATPRAIEEPVERRASAWARSARLMLPTLLLSTALGAGCRSTTLSAPAGSVNDAAQASEPGRRLLDPLAPSFDPLTSLEEPLGGGAGHEHHHHHHGAEAPAAEASEPPGEHAAPHEGSMKPSGEPGAAPEQGAP